MASTSAIELLLERLNHPALPGIELSLGRMRQLLAMLGHPERALPTIIHVAGTNGKGSTIAFLQAMLEAQGHRVHRYSSPHLLRFKERIVLQGTPISDRALLPLLQRVAMAAELQPVTFFEATTAVAFLAFAQMPADYLLLEVGMGGRFDATNVVTPAACVITPIGMDHTEFLGSTLAAIAQEKAGILKPDVLTVIGQQLPEAMRALRTGKPLLRHGNEWHYARAGKQLKVTLMGRSIMLALPNLVGEHQLHNAALAAVTLAALGEKIAPNASRQAQWPGRLQQLTRGPLVRAWTGPIWLDGAHNAHAAASLAAWASTQRGEKILICGLLPRKDAAAFFEALGEAFTQIITIRVPGQTNRRFAQELAKHAREAGQQARAAGSWEEAFAALERYRGATVVIAGSLYLAGAVLKFHA